MFSVVDRGSICHRSMFLAHLRHRDLQEMLCAGGIRCADEHTASVIKAPRLREASGYGAEYGECLHRACADGVAFLDEQAQRTSAIGRPQAGVGRSGDSAGAGRHAERFAVLSRFSLFRYDSLNANLF